MVSYVQEAFTLIKLEFVSKLNVEHTVGIELLPHFSVLVVIFYQ